MWVPDGEVDFLAVWRAGKKERERMPVVGQLRHSAPVPIHAEEAPLSSILRSCGEHHLTVRANGDVAAEIEIAVSIGWSEPVASSSLLMPVSR